MSIPDTYVKRHRVFCALHNASERNEKHDAEFCPQCDRWLVDACDDPQCTYCLLRPALPSEVRP